METERISGKPEGWPKLVQGTFQIRGGAAVYSTATFSVRRLLQFSANSTVKQLARNSIKKARSRKKF